MEIIWHLENLETSREEFENYVSVKANVITSKIPTPEEIVAEIQAKVDENKRH